jgi:hypothetical protein
MASKEAQAAAESAPADHVAKIAAGYTFEEPSIQLGAAVVDGTVHPDAAVRLPLAMMNRHGLVSGATGTGKTITLQVIAEQLSAGGVPVFLADPGQPPVFPWSTSPWAVTVSACPSGRRSPTSGRCSSPVSWI